MPELPEVEVLVRHLQKVLPGRVVRGVHFGAHQAGNSTPHSDLERLLPGTRFKRVSRRAKYVLFNLETSTAGRNSLTLLAHLGMTGRLYLIPKLVAIPRHAIMVMDLGADHFIFEDSRRFGRMSLDLSVLERLGPEPWDKTFTWQKLHAALSGSRQPIKVRLLDQAMVAGVGNIYASEILFQAGIAPQIPARNLSSSQCRKLHAAIRRVLRQAIDFGSSLRLDWSHSGADRLFYFGHDPSEPAMAGENLRVYGREGLPCLKCHGSIQKLVQAGRSTFFCPRCQTQTSRVPAPRKK